MQIEVFIFDPDLRLQGQRGDQIFAVTDYAFRLQCHIVDLNPSLKSTHSGQSLCLI